MFFFSLFQNMFLTTYRKWDNRTLYLWNCKFWKIPTFNDKYITHTTCLKIVAKNEIYNKIITIQYNYSIYSNMTIYIYSQSNVSKVHLYRQWYEINVDDTLSTLKHWRSTTTTHSVNGLGRYIIPNFDNLLQPNRQD